MDLLGALGIRHESGNGGDPHAAVDSLITEVRQGGLTIDYLTERIAELELTTDEIGWTRLGSEGSFDFTRSWLDALIRHSRIMYLKNPLIMRSVSLPVLYVWAQGVSIQAKGPVGNAITRFLDDPANIVSFTGHQARKDMDRDLRIEGNVFFRFFTQPTTGRVKVRRLQVPQVRRLVYNPQDDAEVWFYLRSWCDEKSATHEVLYPDWRYRLTKAGDRAQTYEGYPVEWDTPVYHVKTNALSGMDFGIPEMYAGLDWARAYKEFLENWHKIVKSLARWSWQAKTGGGKKAVTALANRLDSTLSPTTMETNPPPVAGSVAVTGEGVDLSPIKTSGATVAADDGRRLLLMVAATAGLPEIFYGDADVGNHATAKTLDRPTELSFVDRQTMWSGVFTDVLGYVVDCAAKAPENGDLDVQGFDPITGQLLLGNNPETGKPWNRTIDIDWPPILQHDPYAQIGAIVSAATLDGKTVQLLDDAEMLTRMLLTALGEDDVEDAVRRLYPEDGQESDAKRVSPPPVDTPPPPFVVVVPPQSGPSSPEETAAAQRLTTERVAAMQELRAALATLTKKG